MQYNKNVGYIKVISQKDKKKAPNFFGAELKLNAI